MTPFGWDRLRRYQQHAAQALACGWKHGLYMCAGSGKTSVVLAALQLADVAPPWLFLTRAIGRQAWVRDAKWTLGLDYVPGVLGGTRTVGDGYTPPRRLGDDPVYTDLDLLLSEHSSVVSNYDVIDSRFAELDRVPWSAVILDESHNLKGGYQLPKKDVDGNTVRTRYHYVKELVVKVQKRRGKVWSLTATPIRNRRRDLWSQLDLVLPGPAIPGPGHEKAQMGWRSLTAINRQKHARGEDKMWFTSLYRTFDDRYCLPGVFGPALIYPEIFNPPEQAASFLRRYCCAAPGTYGLTHEGESQTEELERRLERYFLKLTREDIADELPAVQRIAKMVEQRRGRVPRAYMGGGHEEAIARAAWAKMDEGIELTMNHAGQGERVVVVTTRRRLTHEVFSAVEKAVQYLSPKIRREIDLKVVTGEIDPIRRKQTTDDFNERKGPGILVASMDSISESINLHYIHTVVVLALPYTPGQLDQFEGRFARLGGIPVVVYYLIADGTIDQKIRGILGRKLEDVVQVGTDTAAAAKVLGTFGDMVDEDKILAELRAYLRGASEAEKEG